MTTIIAFVVFLEGYGYLGRYPLGSLTTEPHDRCAWGILIRGDIHYETKGLPSTLSMWKLPPLPIGIIIVAMMAHSFHYTTNTSNQLQNTKNNINFSRT